MSPHTHSHQASGPARGHRLTLALLIPAVVLTAVGMLLLWPSEVPKAAEPVDGPQRAYGRVVAVSPQVCPPAAEDDPEPAPGAPEQQCGTVRITLTTGAEVTAEIPNGPGAVRPSAGDDVVLLVLDAGPGAGPTYSIMDYQRSRELWILLVAFVAAVVAFGRWRGLAALGGLAVTFSILFLFVVPAILDGRSPVLVAVVGAAAIMLTVLYLTHGFNTSTSVAVAGTLVSLAITAVLSALATAGTHLSGIADETASFLNITNGDVNMRGLLLAGIVIGSLGVLDDVTVTQSATVSELAVANPAYGFRQLYGAATRIGRAHIASVINTIVLAYAGASLPLILLFAGGGTPVGELLTGELVAQELVRSAVGTIGLIAAVPITTALAAFVAARTAKAAPAGPVSPPPPDDPWQAFVENRTR